MNGQMLWSKSNNYHTSMFRSALAVYTQQWFVERLRYLFDNASGAISYTIIDNNNNNNITVKLSHAMISPI